ncbi:MAG: hypothetical protein A2277_15185 [Desulfobacterales bacterium RIFOXYA12_FULL_46_15]|nr:MAG: hypothetical protein A2277_15185 [Desulfobacterales bacterium RIFOXYA12_FULL_46_15]
MNSIKFTYITLGCLILFYVFIVSSTASSAVFLQTMVISGKIISITPENTILLDDGSSYYPEKKLGGISIKPQEYVTLRYYINDRNERIFIEYEPGKNTLKEIPEPKKTKKPKNKL